MTPWLLSPLSLYVSSEVINIFCLIHYVYKFTLPRQAHCLVSIPDPAEGVVGRLQWVRPGTEGTQGKPRKRIHAAGRQEVKAHGKNTLKLPVITHHDKHSVCHPPQSRTTASHHNRVNSSSVGEFGLGAQKIPPRYKGVAQH